MVPGLAGHMAVVSIAGGHSINCDGIFVMNADGSSARRITPPGVMNFFSVLSPDGRQAGFEGRCGPNGADALCLVNVDGTNLHALLVGVDVGGIAWSPDGTRVAFERQGDGHNVWEIHTIAVDGTDERAVTHDGSESTQPSWSPDGGRSRTSATATGPARSTASTRPAGRRCS
jgi:TolB protein